MAKLDDNTAVSVRMPQEWLDRMDALVERLSDDPKNAGIFAITRSTVIRKAILLGLERMEEQYGGTEEL